MELALGSTFDGLPLLDGLVTSLRRYARGRGFASIPILGHVDVIAGPVRLCR